MVTYDSLSSNKSVFHGISSMKKERTVTATSTKPSRRAQTIWACQRSARSSSCNNGRRTKASAPEASMMHELRAR